MKIIKKLNLENLRAVPELPAVLGQAGKGQLLPGEHTGHAGRADQRPTDRVAAVLASGRRRPVGHVLRPDRQVRRSARRTQCLETACFQLPPARWTQFMTLKLREYACKLRAMHKAGQDRQRRAGFPEGRNAVHAVYRMLCICLGEPPKTVDAAG